MTSQNPKFIYHIFENYEPEKYYGDIETTYINQRVQMSMV